MELFETFDEHGTPQGQVPRQIVHSRGLWHKSAQVFVFNAQGELLLAQRAADKDLYADLWDYSVGEHLKPGETHLMAAYRGLLEELGIHAIHLEPLGGLRWVVQQGENFRDREIQQAYRGIYDGKLVPDPAEVQAIEYVALPELHKRVELNPRRFTPWLLEDLCEFNLFGER
ncbi:MAG: NUDIX domain-containing protein [Pseudomonadaceae bacterium]|nr:NUDIX domain-containing protein [Pseudomonadaceae bacterium]